MDALAQLSWHVQSSIGDAAAVHGISLSQLRLLGILRDREPEMLALARYLRLDKSSVSGLVARAEVRGLVERTALATDGRRVADARLNVPRQLRQGIHHVSSIHDMILVVLVGITNYCGWCHELNRRLS